MNDSKLIILSVAVLILIYYANKYIKGRRVAQPLSPANIRIQAVTFFEQFLSMLKNVGAQPEKGMSVLDGTIKMHGGEGGTYILQEDGGWITYLGISLYFSLDDAEINRGYNDASTKIFYFILSRFIKDDRVIPDFFEHLTAPVFELEETENIIETENVRFRCYCDWDYSKVDSADVPVVLQHIKKPAVFSLEVTPVKIDALKKK